MGDRSDKKCGVRNFDMTEAMKEDAKKKALEAVQKFNSFKDIAQFIKKEFDKAHSPTWHCIVGRAFGSAVKHESKNFIYYYVGEISILLFKS